MPRNDEPTTIGAILEMPPSRGRDDKQWIPGPFEAVVKNAKERRPRGGGRSFWTCEMEDPHDPNLYLECTGDVDFTRMEGSLVLVGGSGASREEYNGKPQVKLSRNSVVQVLGRGAGGDRSHPPPAHSPSETGTYHSQSESSQQESKPYGPMVGGAVETAAKVIVATPDCPKPGTPAFAKLLWEVASDVFRVNHLLQSGFNKLAPKASDRADPKAAKAREEEAQRKQEEERRKAEEERIRKEAEEQASNQSAEAAPEDDDIPF